MNDSPKPRTRKKAAEAPVSDETTETAPDMPDTLIGLPNDPLVLASSCDVFSIHDLAHRTGVPAREIRNALGPVIDDGSLRRIDTDQWQWQNDPE